MKYYLRKQLFSVLWENLNSAPNLIQVIVGPRQVGKTTLALQIFGKWGRQKEYHSADNPNIPSADWITGHWQKARILAKKSKRPFLLIFDEIQKIPNWSEAIKRLFDEDIRFKVRIRVVLLGSSTLLMQKGLTESLAGRFELHRHPHWSFPECKEYFSLTLEEYLYFGGYPGAMSLRKNWQRWSKYIRDSLIETVLSKDILLMMPVAKPALLRQVFGLGVSHPAEILSYQKMIGQLQDAGNTTTIASYLRLLSNAFLLAVLERWSGSRIKQRGSIPKLIVLDNALISAMSDNNFKQSKANKATWGRIAENAVGATLHNLLQDKGVDLFYWRLRDEEVDYVFKLGNRLIAVEVKSTAKASSESNLLSFRKKYKSAELFLISSNKQVSINGINNISLKDFFNDPLKSLAIK